MSDEYFAGLPEHHQPVGGDLEVLRVGSLASAFPTWQRRVFTALSAIGVNEWADFANVTESQLLACPHIGRVRLDKIRAELARRGIASRCGKPSGDVPIPASPTLPWVRAIRERYNPQAAPRAGVYFVRCGRFVKIGVSEDVRIRYANLYTTIPSDDMEPLGFIGVNDGSDTLEGELHQRFAAKRYKGEWFLLDDELRAFIASNAAPWPAKESGGKV